MLKFINLYIFLASFFIGLFFVYMLGSDRKIIYAYPSPNTYNDIIIKDDADNCYKYHQTQVDCEKNKDKIKSFPIQHLSTEKEIEAPKFLGLF